MGRNNLSEVAVTSAPAAEPVLIADLTDAGGDFLRIDFADDDALITTMITSAREWVEKYIGRALITQTRRAWYKEYANRVDLPYGPIQSITTVKTVSLDGTSTTLTNDQDYYIKGVNDQYIDFTGVTSIPAGHSPTDSTAGYHLDVVYVCGYGTSGSDVPAPINEAIKRLVLHFYENRNEVVAESVNNVPFGVTTLLAPYKHREVLI